MQIKTHNSESDNLKEILFFFKNNWAVLVLSGLIAGLIGTYFAFTVDAKYLASADIGVGRVSNSNVEEPIALLSKLKTPSFYSKATIEKCELDYEESPGPLLVKRLNPLLATGQMGVTISFKAGSSNNAKICLESVLEDVKADHLNLAKGEIKSKSQRIENLKSQLNKIEYLYSNMTSRKIDVLATDSKTEFAATLMIQDLTIKVERDVIELRQNIDNLQKMMSFPYTKEASFLAPINNPVDPVEPRKSPMVLKSIFLGVGMMIVLLLIRRYFSHKN